MAICSNCGNESKNIIYFGDLCLCNRCISYVPALIGVKDKDIRKLVRLHKKKSSVIYAMKKADYKEEVINTFSSWLDGYASEELAQKSIVDEEELQKKRYEEKVLNTIWPKIIDGNDNFFKKKINPEGLIDSKTYLFKDHAQFRDKVYDMFIECAKECRLPATISVKTFKAGGMLLGSKADMLCIDGGFTPFIVVNTNVCGSYLFVTYYLLVEESFGNKLMSKYTGLSLKDLASFGHDLISISALEAFIATTQFVLEESFARLGFIETKSGFFGI